MDAPKARDYIAKARWADAGITLGKAAREMPRGDAVNSKIGATKAPPSEVRRGR